MRILVAFGVGLNFYSLVERLDKVCTINAFCDNDSHKWGQYLMGDERVCLNPKELLVLDNPYVIIMSEKESSRIAIENQLDSYGVSHCRVYDFLEKIELTEVDCQWPQTIQNKRIHKFIELLVHGTTQCNFHCEYCYVWNQNEFTPGIETSQYTPAQWREALSLERLGGVCHINACALGETMLSKDIVELAFGLLEEGHYLSIITNGTISKKIEDILLFPPLLLQRMFFKLSFHYEELKKKNFLGRFWDNVEKIKNSPCSYSIEITPCDSLIKDIESVKREFKGRAAGVLPHITFARDGTKEGLDLLSNLSLKEYKNTWKIFDSSLFDLKSDMYKRKITETCYAGWWSYRINVVNGNLQSCYKQKLSGSIFDNVEKAFPILTVNKDCHLDYCFNNHAFLTWGNVPEIECEDYYSMRSRIAEDGTCWIKPSYAAAMKQKLYDNNFAYVDRWPDYEKLFKSGRKPSFILLNSPDYSNLGDHAIALATREFFQYLFPDREFIEISCEQYIKENLLIKKVITKEDILLISGGGYLGSLWLWLEDITKNIIGSYPDNKIIILPQTIYFENSFLGISERRAFAEICNKHQDLTVIVREQASYEQITKLLVNSVKKMLIPDMVLSMKYHKDSIRKGALICFREDKESLEVAADSIENVLREKGFSVDIIDTVLEDDINLTNRKIYVKKLLDKFISAEIVVTDRLHAMIFCAITSTPCVAFDNISGKISATFKWLSEESSIILCRKEEKFTEYLLALLERNKNKNREYKLVNEKFKELQSFLKGNCFI